MSYVVATPGSTVKKGVYDFSNLGSLFCRVAETLASRDEWKVKVSKKAPTGRFHMVLGEAQAGNIPFKLLAGYDSLYPGLVPLCNFYRGFNTLCRKTMMVKTLRSAVIAGGRCTAHYTPSCIHICHQCDVYASYLATLPPDATGAPPFLFEDICPASFMFFPAKPEDSERDIFIETATRLETLAQAQKQQGRESGGQDVIWIVKPSDGCKGHSITLFSSHTEVLAFIDSQTEGSISWVVQRYITNPVLIPAGKRKFDIRIWVVLDADYNIHVYRRGALRVASQSYVTSNSKNDQEGKGGGIVDLSDIHAHLSNHCIAETHPDYGKYEPTNEIWYDEFEDILFEMTGGQVSFGRDLMPKIHATIRHSLLAVKERLQGSESSGGYRSFNVFGYDFMLSKEWEGESPPSPRTKKTTATATRTEDVSSSSPHQGQMQQRWNEQADDLVKVWLLEINSSPAVAEDLLADFVEDLLAVVVDPFFPPEEENREEQEEKDTTVSSSDTNNNTSVCSSLTGSDNDKDKGSGCGSVTVSEKFPRGFDCIYVA